MGGWQVTEQAIAAMNNMSARLQELVAKIHSETEKMKSSFEETQDGLGAHSADIQALIDEVEETEQGATIPVKKLVLKLQRAALIRRKHIEYNAYGGRLSTSGVKNQRKSSSVNDVSKSKAKDTKKKIDSERKAAVSAAWLREKELVLQGKGTRDWTVAQQHELLSTNPPHISGFEGQHMKDVSTYPEYASDPNNIQWLTYEEHIIGAHKTKTTNSTNGYFDTKTGEIIPFKDDEKPSVPIIELTDKYDPSQEEFVSKLGRSFGYGRKEDRAISKERHKGEKSNRHFGKED